jgi:hypothetical protein
MLSALPAEMSSQLFAKARTVSLAADATLFHAGDAGDGCYRVDDGLLKASMLSPTGGERILAIFGPGAVIGELSMIDGAPRPHRSPPSAPPNCNQPRTPTFGSANLTSTSTWWRCWRDGCDTMAR